MHERLPVGDEALIRGGLPARSQVAAPRTNWNGVVLTLLMPLTIAGGFVWYALRTEWNDTGEWALGMLLLIPLEFVRIVVFWILSEAYREFRTPLQAAGFFLLTLLVLALIGLVIASFELGPRDTLAMLADPHTWRVAAVPAALIIADGVINLLCFRGDRDCEAARLEAQGDDARDWFMLVLYASPFLVLLPCFVLFVVLQGNPSLPDWLPRGGDGARAVCLLYVALYFTGKGLLLARVHGARFMATGRRAFDDEFLQFVLERDAEKRRAGAKEEAKKAAARRRLFMGEGSTELS